MFSKLMTYRKQYLGPWKCLWSSLVSNINQKCVEQTGWWWLCIILCAKVIVQILCIGFNHVFVATPLSLIEFVVFQPNKNPTTWRQLLEPRNPRQFLEKLCVAFKGVIKKYPSFVDQILEWLYRIAANRWIKIKWAYEWKSMGKIQFWKAAATGMHTNGTLWIDVCPEQLQAKLMF